MPSQGIPGTGVAEQAGTGQGTGVAAVPARG
ncbi:hypothetical protein HNR10_000807 [Nocardiopsis aegyptia]|uniref:Uncharacterized protein n=1 Tax=Nocardiopsis aegyptia TaxID=220378 RepID=A0A7Z0J8F3_9ACTN|nr:hypothetical protein [Nocardiopsis aegyptia]